MPEPGQEPASGATSNCVLKTSADVKALTYCGLQQLSGRGLAEVLKLYPEYAAAFRAGLLRDLTFNLRQGSDPNVCRPLFRADLSSLENTVHFLHPETPAFNCRHPLPFLLTCPISSHPSPAPSALSLAPHTSSPLLLFFPPAHVLPITPTDSFPRPPHLESVSPGVPSLLYVAGCSISCALVGFLWEPEVPGT